MCMVYEGDAARLHVTTKNANKLTQYTKNTCNGEVEGSINRPLFLCIE